MKKALIGGVIVLVIAAGLVFYFLNQRKNLNLDQAGQPSSSTGPGQSPQQENPYVGEDFTLVAPAGWIQSNLPSTLVSYQNAKETHPQGSAAAKINFKSYIAVSFDNTNGQTSTEVANLVKYQTQSVVPAISFTQETNGLVDDQPARFLEADLKMQDVDFKVMIAVVAKGDKYFTISFNTTAEKWPEYKGMFYATANSFEFKY